MKKFNILAGACLLALGLASTAQASDPAPVGGCPPAGDWGLCATRLLLPQDVGNKSDSNEDELVCARVNSGQTAKNGFPTLTVRENSISIPPGATAPLAACIERATPF